MYRRLPEILEDFRRLPKISNNPLCDNFRRLQKISRQHQMSKTNFEVHMKLLKELGKWNWLGNLIPCDCTIASKLWNLFSQVPMRNNFWCYFRQLFISLAFRKCRKDCTIVFYYYYYYYLYLLASHNKIQKWLPQRMTIS